MNRHWTPIIVVLLITTAKVNTDWGLQTKTSVGKKCTYAHINIYGFVSFIILNIHLMRWQVEVSVAKLT